ncbi:MAG: hypothetical protein IKS20_02470, partial [Victivallales bacterium]|nr:hypothetical protein [Victivallales bacterium]
SGAPPLSIGLLSAHVPLYYKVKDMYANSYNHNDPGKTLKNIATREFLLYMASADFTELLGNKRHAAGEELRRRIQKAATEVNLGVEIVFVSLAGLHPPVSVGTAYDQVVASREAKAEEILKAEAYAASSEPAVQGVKAELIHKAEAYKQEKVQVSQAEAQRFESQLMSYNASPRLFKLNSYLELLSGNSSARKYILATANAKEVLELNLEKKMNASLLDLNLGEEEKTE